jgi:hypothetical protein
MLSQIAYISSRERPVLSLADISGKAIVIFLGFKMPESWTSAIRYFVAHSGETKGPFDMDMIEAFVLRGYYPRDVQICAEDSTNFRWSS